jgi:peptide/nickel transport system permease protein
MRAEAALRMDCEPAAGPRAVQRKAAWPRWLWRYSGILVGLAVLLIFLGVGFFLPLPFDPRSPDPYDLLGAPDAAHWFGTDQNGADIFSRTLAGARYDLPLAIVAAILSCLAGVPIGLWASANTRGARILMQALDVLQSFPLIILSLVLIALGGNDVKIVVIAIVVAFTPQIIRLVRSEAMVVRASRYVEAAYMLGASPLRVMTRHILPNVAGIILAQGSLALGHALQVIATLGFLGVGVAPGAASWGAMIQSGVGFVQSGYWWLVFFPGMAILIFVMAVNAIADGLGTLLSAEA